MRDLDVSENQLELLDLSPCAQLAQLDAGANRFASITNIAHLPLIEMCLRGNVLETLPPLPSTLCSLMVRDNRLTELPNPLPPSLRYLSARNNQLASLPHPLPELVLVYNKRLAYRTGNQTLMPLCKLEKNLPLDPILKNRSNQIFGHVSVVYGSEVVGLQYTM